MGSLTRKLTAAAAAVIIAAAAQLCLSCSSCGRGDDKKAAADSAALAGTPEVILEGPLALDEGSLRSYAAAIGANASFDEADMAKMIRLSEGAFSHLMQELDQLQANGDAADSYNVLTEIAASRWPDDAALILSFLRTVPLPRQMQLRTDQLVRTAARCIVQMDEISAQQLRGRQILRLTIDPLKK